MAETGPGEHRLDLPALSPKAKGDVTRIIIKKYANRRLYNTGSSSYVTLEHLAEMVKQGVDFVVYDARTTYDITRQVLTQIIFEAENSGQNMLPIQFLRQLIKLYGHQIQALVPGYLEMSLDAFALQKDTMREKVGGIAFAAPSFPGGEGYRMFEEQVRQNMVLFDRAMKMFTPFAYGRPDEAPTRPAPPPDVASSPPAPETVAPETVAPETVAPETVAPETAATESLAELKSRLDEMQRKIEQLVGKG